MPTLDIAGQQVQVGDEFLKLPVDQQHSTVESIAKSLNLQPAKPGGMVSNLGAGANELMANVIGAPVDAAGWLINKIASPFTGTAGDQFGPETKLSVPPSMANVPQPPEPRPLVAHPFGGSESIKSALGVIGANPDEVGANTWEEQAARGVGGGAAGMVAPYMGARALLARGIGAAAPAIEGAQTISPGSLSGAAIRMAGGPAGPEAGMLRTGLGAAGNAAVGAFGSLGGQGAEALLPEGSQYRPLANFAGQMFGGGAAAGGMGLGKAGINYGAGLARDTLGPMRPATLENGVPRNAALDRIVGQKLLSTSADPALLRDALDNPNPEIVPGSRPTTFQLSGDQGVGQLERAQRTTDPGAFLERTGEQNAARVGVVQGLAPESANPGAARDLLQQHLDALNAAGDANVTAARANAQQMLDMAGGRLSPVEQGTLMREQMEAAKAATKRQESALWQAIDPDGKLTINAVPVREAAQQIAAEIPATARKPAGEEAAVLDFAKMGGTAVPFSEFAALRGRLLQAIREERVNGQTPELRRMQQLRASMDGAISNAADIVAEQQAKAVAAGTLAPEQTLIAKFERALKGQAEGFLAGRAAEGAGGNTGIRATGVPGGGVAASGGAAGTGISPGGGFGNPTGNPGLSGETQPLANFNADAAMRYRVAADATRQRAATFNNQTVGPLLAERNNDYRLLASQVPERVIRSAESVKAFTDAGGAPQAVHDALVMDLRRAATKPDGSLDPVRYQSWLNRRAEPLRAFPDLQTRLANVSDAQQTVDARVAAVRQTTLDFERGAARHFLNAEPDQAVRSALGSKNPVADMRELTRLTATDPDARAGLQRAVAEYIAKNFVGNTEVATSGVAGLKADAFQTFLKQKGSALREIFSPEQMQGMADVAADLQRSNRSIVGSKLPGQSNTMQDAAAVGKLSLLKAHVLPHMGEGTLAFSSGLGGYLLAGGGLGGGIGGVAAAVGVPLAKRVVDSIKRAGMERADALLTEALLNPDLAKTLLMKASPGNRPFIAQRMAGQLSTLAGEGVADQRRKGAAR